MDGESMDDITTRDSKFDIDSKKLLTFACMR
jgi:hypothetical protein